MAISWFVDFVCLGIWVVGFFQDCYISQNISLAFMQCFPGENDIVKKRILCSCKSNPFISMA